MRTMYLLIKASGAALPRIYLQGTNNMTTTTISNTVNKYKIEDTRGSIEFYTLEALQAHCKRKIANYGERFASLAAPYIDPKIKTTACAYATKIGYTDRHPFEIIRVVSDKTIEVRALDTELVNKHDLEFNVGGFSAHCSNQDEQQYKFTSNSENPIYRLRLQKGARTYTCKGQTFTLAEKPYKFYDFNF